MQYGLTKIGDYQYYFHPESGKRMSGWIKLDSVWYFFDTTTGRARTDLSKIGNCTYFFNKEGQMQTGFVTVDGSVRYFNSSGQLCCGLRKIDGSYYYFAFPNGERKSGWIQHEDTWYYFAPADGKAVIGLCKIGNCTYYFNSEGKMQTGFVTNAAGTRYFRSGGQMQTGFFKVDGGDTCYGEKNGLLRKGFLAYDNNYYYFKDDFRMAKGFYTVDGFLRYFNDDGSMIRNRKVNGTYYADFDGVCKKASESPYGTAIFNVLDKVNAMTLEEKVAQMFFVLPGVLNIKTYADAKTTEIFNTYPVGGVIYFSENLVSASQIQKANKDLSNLSLNRLGLPIFLSTDEEGGRVSRLSGKIESTVIRPMLEQNTNSAAYAATSTIATYMKKYGFNMDFAPDADIWSNPANTVIGNRAFGKDAATVSARLPYALKGFLDNGILPTIKHFPGHGDTAEDSHVGFAFNYKTMNQLRSCELVPFKTGINSGSPFVMVGHISFPNVTGTTPATLSKYWVTDVLKGELNFSGIAITDSMAMAAVSKNFPNNAGVIEAVNAGIDMILMPTNFTNSYTAVLQAVYAGKIPETRINDAIIRILYTKMYRM